MRTLTTGPDAQWAAARDGNRIVLFGGGAPPPVSRLELATDECDIALVGPPNVLAVVSRTPARVTLYEPPYLEAVAALDLAAPARLLTTIGQRLVLLDADGRNLVIVRTQGRALSVQKVDPGSPVEFAVGLERNQVLLALHKKLEVWDAVSGRPVLRPQLALPPAPRIVGAAQGHLWATRPSSDEVFVYRLSDGRPFRHRLGAPVESVVSHPASPLVVLVTPRGLVRLHCFAHSLLLVEGAPYTPGTPLALLVDGDDVALIGAPESGDPWTVGLGGHTAPQVAPEPDAPEGTAATAIDKLRTMRAAPNAPGELRAAHGDARAISADGRVLTRGWRDALATYAQELVRGLDSDVPVVAADSELGTLAQRLELSANARRALIALYALYLVGEPAVSIARLAKALGDWTEPLGQGDLAALALVDKTGGKLALRRPVTELLDGAAPVAVRLVGGPPTTPRAGAFRVSRDGRADGDIAHELAALLGRIAVVDGDLATGVLEARLLGATAVSFAPPGDKPRPWPRGAGLVLVLYGTQTAWVADLPTVS